MTAVNPFVVPNAAEDVQLQNILNKTAPQNFVLKLFQNNHTPAATDTEANYTEATFTGYASATLAGASWTIVEGDPTTATYAAQTFTSSANQAAQTIYGYYYVQASSGKIMGAQLFDTAQVIKSNGDSITVTPIYTGQSAA